MRARGDVTIMDLHFCRRYAGDGTPPSNRYCRVCPEAACDRLWQRVRDLAASNGTDPVPRPRRIERH